MRRSGARLSAAVTVIAGLGLVMALSAVDAASPAATPGPSACGTPITSWSGASANDVGVELLRVEQTEAPPPATPATPAATPDAAAAPTFFVELRFENRGDGPATIAVADITLDLCHGANVHATTEPGHPPLTSGPLPTGETRTGWVAFVVGAGDVPVRLVVPVSRPDLVGGRVEFPLVAAGPGTVVAAIAAPAETTGGDSYGGDAYGGDGADGADATGEAGNAEHGS
jgi:hypothetical protein